MYEVYVILTNCFIINVFLLEAKPVQAQPMYE